MTYTLSAQLRGPNELPAGTNFTQAVSNTSAPTLTDVTPGIGIASTTLTLTGTNFVAGETNVLIGTDFATSINVASATSITCVVGTDYGDGTQKDVTVFHNLLDITNLTYVDDNYHDTITATFTVASVAASEVVLRSKETNSITPSWSSPTLTIAGTNWTDVRSHLSNIEVLTGNYSSVFTIAISIADDTSTGTTGTLTVTPPRATTVNGYTQNTPPVWSTSSGTLGTFDDYAVVSVSVAATDADSHALTYTIASGSLPAGLSISSSGAITGTASGVATNTTSTFTVQVSDGFESTTREFSITVNDVAHIIWSTSSGTLGTHDEYDLVSLSVAATDAYGHALTYTIASGSLPAGLSISSSGAITGTALGVVGNITSTFTVQVSDGFESTTREFSITVNDLAHFDESTNVFVQHTSPLENDYLSHPATGPGSSKGSVVDGSLIAVSCRTRGTGNKGSIFVFKTADSGTSWTQQQELENNSTLADDVELGSYLDMVGDVIVASTKEGVTSTGCGTTTWNTSDSGANWTLRNTISSELRPKITLDGSTYRMATRKSDGTALETYYSTDGATWTADQTIENPSAYAYMSRTFDITGNYLIAKVYNGTDNDLLVYKRGAGGTPWTLQETLTGGEIHSLSADGDYFAVIDADIDIVIYKTTDSGSSWALEQTITRHVDPGYYNGVVIANSPSSGTKQLLAATSSIDGEVYVWQSTTAQTTWTLTETVTELAIPRYVAIDPTQNYMAVGLYADDTNATNAGAIQVYTT